MLELITFVKEVIYFDLIFSSITVKTALLLLLKVVARKNTSNVGVATNHVADTQIICYTFVRIAHSQCPSSYQMLS